MAKSPDAFRTISEVSEWLDTPAHVLRFWESKFTQIRPVKRAGGRRYYRPEDMALLGGIKMLLHEQGMTIKGVQKLLREQGIRHVAGLGPQPLTDSDGVIDALPFVLTGAVADALPDAMADTAPALAAQHSINAAPLTGLTSDPMTEDQPAQVPPVSAPPVAAPRVSAQLAPAVFPATAPPAPVPTEPAPPVQPAAQLTLPIVAAPFARRRRALPDLPPDAPAGPGILSAILARDPAALARKGARLAPVVQRLAALRDHLRATL